MNMISVSSSVQIGMFHLPFVNPQCSALGYPVEKRFRTVACACLCGQINIGCARQKIQGSYGRSARDAASAGGGRYDQTQWQGTWRASWRTRKIVERSPRETVRKQLG